MRRMLSWVGRHVFWSVILLFSLVLTFYYLTLYHPYHEYLCKRFLIYIFPEIRVGTAHLVNIFGFFALCLTVIGLYYTWLQISLANDRIEGYARFYEWALVALEEIQERKCSRLQFSGSTIQPGNVAFEDNRGLIGKFSTALKQICEGKDAAYTSLEDISIVVPNELAYEYNYSYFKTRILAKTKHTEDQWLAHVDNQRRAAIELQKACHRDRQKDTAATASDTHTIPVPNIDELSTTDERMGWLNAYYLSNGRRVVYAVPLHFVSKEEDTKGRFARFQPSLIGFTTTDPGVVSAFESHFERLFRHKFGTEELEKMLTTMYQRHIVCPQYIQKRATVLSASLWDTFDNYAHDHFGGMKATDDCVRDLSINAGSNVLDIGSGLGAPAIRIAQETQCRVTGVELSDERCEFAEAMAKLATEEKRLQDWQVTFKHADAIDYMEYLRLKPYGDKFSHFVSLLSILHLPQKQDFLEGIAAVLKADGKIFIEDYCRARNLDEPELEQLLDTISCPGLLDLGEYIQCLENGGIRVIELRSKTDEWRNAASERVKEYENNRSIYEQLVGVDRARAALAFAGEVLDLFDNKLIIGVRIVGQKIARG